MPQPSPESPPADDIRVLYVEDDSVDSLGLTRKVRQHHLPWTLVTINSRAAALAALRRPEDYDVAIIDYKLGDGSGLDLLSYLGSTPAIIVTGQGCEAVAAEALRLGALGYVIKDQPRAYLELLPLEVRRVLERRQIEVELHRALAQLAVVGGKLPICSNCRRAVGSDGQWQSLADLIRIEAAVELHHQICPACRRRLAARREVLGPAEERSSASVVPMITVREAYERNYPGKDPAVRMTAAGYPEDAGDRRGERLEINRLAAGGRPKVSCPRPAAGGDQLPPDRLAAGSPVPQHGADRGAGFVKPGSAWRCAMA